MAATPGTLGSTERQEADLALLERIARGDESALAELYDRYGRILYAFVMRMVRSVEEAEEILQDVFFQVWGRADTFQPARGSIYRWLVGMSRQRAVDRTRARGIREHHHPIDIENLILVAESSPADPESPDDQKLVVRALKNLSPEQQKVIALAFFEGLSQSEIAERTRTAVAMVRMQMRSALLALRMGLLEHMAR